MHRIHPNFQSARSKFYDECLARDLGVAESSQVKFAAARHLFLNQTGRNYTILPVNRVMLYMMWLRFYPSYHNLAFFLPSSKYLFSQQLNL
jgi:hypothetical protein